MSRRQQRLDGRRKEYKTYEGFMLSIGHKLLACRDDSVSQRLLHCYNRQHADARFGLSVVAVFGS
jgi:hypothetical protein